MKKQIILWAMGLLLTAGFAAEAQQVPMFSQYYFHRYYINPAYAGSTPRQLEIGSNNRQQYMGFENSPYTNTLYGHSSIGYSRWSVGGRFLNDYIKPVTTQGLWASVTYRLPVSGNSFIAFAVEPGVMRRQADLASLRLNDEVDQVFNYADTENNFIPDAGAGIYFHSERFWTGISAKHLAPFQIANRDYSRNDEATLARHYYAMAGGSIHFGYDWALEPSAMLKLMEYGEFQFDGTIGGVYKELLYLGASYRTDVSVIPYVGLKLWKQLLVAYSYDRQFGDFSDYNNGSHELSLRWTKPLRPPILKKSVDPRYYK